MSSLNLGDLPEGDLLLPDAGAQLVTAAAAAAAIQGGNEVV